VTHPTDAKLMLTAIAKLGALAKAQGLRLRQSYARLAKRAALMAGRYTHAKQFKRANRELRFLRTRLGRLIRDIRRKIEGDETLQKLFAEPLDKAHKSAGRTTISAAASSIPGTRRRPSASAKARRTSPTSSASKSPSPPPTAAARAASLSSMPRRCPAIPMTATRWAR